MENTTVKDKSFIFAIEIIKLFQQLQHEKSEFILSRQMLRSGTAIGALISESEYAESKLDFIHKLAIARKECNETIYWLELLAQTSYIDNKIFESINCQALELLKMLTSTIKTLKRALNNS
jgi:four helix bundle protein